MCKLQAEFKNIVMTAATQTEPLRQEIEQYAYFLYKQRGCQPGHELDDWLEAEKQLSNVAASAAETSSPNPEDMESDPTLRPAGDNKRASRKAQRIHAY